MPRTLARGAVVALTLLTFVVPADVSGAGKERLGADGWAARPIRAGGIPARDRELTAKLPERARVGYHPETRRVRFISGSPTVPLTTGVAAVAAGGRAPTAADARSKARRFMERYGELFGLRAPERDLRVREVRRYAPPKGGGLGTASGLSAGTRRVTVRFDQLHEGLAVMGGEVVVQLSDTGEVLSATGEVMPAGAGPATTARVPGSVARDTAAAWLAREAGRRASAVRTRSEGLAIYDPRLMGAPGLTGSGIHLVWRIDARLPAPDGRRGDHRLVLVDAISGDVVITIGRVVEADRYVCDNRNVPGLPFTCSSPFTRSEGQPAVGVRDVDSAYRIMGVVHDFLADRLGRDGIDDKGGRMKATVRYCNPSGCPWQNAEWNWAQQQAIFGRGWALADDIVAHEFIHGVLDHEAPLFYFYQSGAINESYADVFGEIIDLGYPGGKDNAWARWKIGEDTPRGAFRDMRYPGRFGHPDRVRSPRWHASSTDNGGVHRNSGVGNKAASLMAAGGSFRGFAIEPIGRWRTARIWYHALTTRLTSAADYIDLGDALLAACTDLAGSEGIKLVHCKSVRDATTATQMHLQPLELAPRAAPVCAPGKRAFDVFHDDLEDPASGNWKSQVIVGDVKGWYYPQNPNNRAGWDGSWSSSGVYNFYAPDRDRRVDSVMRMASPVLVPENAYLRFEHGFGFDRDARRRYDGAIVEVKTNGGDWRGVKAFFTHGGYNGRLATGRGNPLAGRRAYTGDSRGWWESRVDLSAFAGELLKVRFRMGSDRSFGGRGWYIDDIRIYTCTMDSDAPSVTVTIAGGDAATADPMVNVALAYADATTWVDKMRISSSWKTNDSGLLRKGLTLPIRDTLTWDLASTAFGSNGGPGTRRVFVQVRDAAGNWSAVASDDIEWVAEP